MRPNRKLPRGLYLHVPLADIPSWDGHAASRARVAMPLKAGGLGIDVLANPDHAAVAAMSSAVASLHAFARDVDNI